MGYSPASILRGAPVARQAQTYSEYCAERASLVYRTDYVGPLLVGAVVFLLGLLVL